MSHPSYASDLTDCVTWRFKKRLKDFVIHCERVKELPHLTENAGSTGITECCSFCVYSRLWEDWFVIHHIL